MQTPSTAARSGRQIAGRVIVTAANNFVERPWGGTQLRELKAFCSLPDQVEVAGAGLGESFELSAFDDDREAAEHPSRILGPNGSVDLLPQLVREHAEALLGERWIAKYGRCIPLLPKFLNVRELLSVQGHPAGHTEAYIVVSAEPGATIRLGFRDEIDPSVFGAKLEAGLGEQQALADLLGEGVDWFAVHRTLSEWFSERDSDAQEPARALRDISAALLSDTAFAQTTRLLESLKQRYWLVLDSMNEIELQPGQVIHNTNPQRIVGAHGRAPAAEVHALGNPERREFVMLEIRRPGPTFRAWDNVRFPMREIDIATALDVLNLKATEPDEFICERRELTQPGHTLSVDSPYFRIEHIEARPGESFDVNAADPHCLHVLAGNVEVETAVAGEPTLLRRGDSAFMPNGVGAWRGRVSGSDLHLVKVHLP